MSDQWRLRRGEREYGPMTFEQIRGLALTGKLPRTVQIRQPGSTEWAEASTFDALFPPAPRSPESESDPELEPKLNSDPDIADSNTSPSSSSRKNGKTKWLIVGAVAVVMIGAALFLLRPKSKRPSELAQNKIQAPTSPEAAIDKLEKKARFFAAKTKKAAALAKQDQDQEEAVEKKTRKGDAGKTAKRARPNADPVERKTAKAAPTRMVQAGLDDIMPLLSEEGYLNEERMPVISNDAWIAKMGYFKQSNDPDVAQAATASATAGFQRFSQDLLRVRETETNREFVEKAFRDYAKVDEGQGWSWIFEPSGDVDQLERDGVIDSGTAQAMRAANAEREARVAQAFSPIAQAIGNSYLTNLNVRNLRRNVRMIQSYVVRKHLVRALRKRAGEMTDASPIEVKFGVGGWRDGWSEAYLTVVSRSDKPLTRVTLLAELKIGHAACIAAYYFPRLEPGARFRGIPIVATNSALRSDLKLDHSRYSLWCDELSVEESQATDLDRDAAQIEYGTQAAQPGMEYLTPTESPRDTIRYRLKFNDLKFVNGVCRVEAQLSRVAADDSQAVQAKAVYSGAVEASPPTQLAELKYSLRSGKDPLIMSLKIGAEGELTWQFRSNQTQGRDFQPASAVMRKESERSERMANFQTNNERLVQARKLAMTGKRAEAEKVLKDFLDSKPSAEWIERANRVIQELDTLENVGRRMKSK